MTTVTAPVLTRALPWSRPLSAADLVGLAAPGVSLRLVEGTLVISRPGGFTRDDRDALPEDGRRHELLDGELVMSPSPSSPHQTAVLELAVTLRTSCPPDLKVMVAPFDVTLADRLVLIPDVLVARRADITHRDLPVAPLLAVEVLSPSTRQFDVGPKRTHYQDFGVRSYWVVDPQEPSLRAWELGSGEYVEVADVHGEETWAATTPFPVTVTPAALLG